jgi:hypothetical protein
LILFFFGKEYQGVIFAECKSYDIFEEEDLLRMQLLASEFPGAIIVFSTFRKSFTEN